MHVRILEAIIFVLNWHFAYDLSVEQYYEISMYVHIFSICTCV